MMQQPRNEDLETTSEDKNQSNIEDHANFKKFCLDGLKFGGVHVVANKAHGKTRLLFNIAETLRQDENIRTIIFDGSETWLYAFSRIPVFTVTEQDVLALKVRTVDQIEKFELQNWNFVRFALDHKKDILFRLKSRKPSKRGFFVRTVVNFLDQQQRDEKETLPNHENERSIAIFLEEAQNAFNSRATASAENEEFLSVFNEARNQKIGFFTASQRLNDFSKTIRAKQLCCIGKVNSEDITPMLKRLQRMHNLDFSTMKPRHWFYEGMLFQSPWFKQNGKPYQVNQDIENAWQISLPKAKTLTEKLKDLFKQKTASAIRTEQDQEGPENSEDRDYYECPNCGMMCSQEEFESGFCLQCDQEEFNL